MMNNEEEPRKTTDFSEVARGDFERARFHGFVYSLKNWFRRGDNTLKPFDEVRRRLPTEAQHYAGMQEVPLDKILGSVGRYQDFDRAFLPKYSFMRSRWESVDQAHLQDINLPPIEVYKLGPFFYVKDGNHRVSVARERGQAFIDAMVTEIVVTVPVDEHTDIDDLISRQESADFQRRTHLDELCQGANVCLSLPGQYSKLLEHIAVHRWYMGEAAHHAVPYSEAVKSWYQDVYLPLVKIIREQDVLVEFPGRTEADLYLWIIEHLWFLREQSSEDVSYESAVAHFTDLFTHRPLHRIWSWIKMAVMRGKKPRDG
jgi:hypothetical protein